MEILGTLSIIIGIIAGLLALAEKIWGIFSKRKRIKKLFKSHYSNWIESGYEYLPNHDDFRKLHKFISETDFSKKELAFCLLCTLQHGDRSMNYLIQKNLNNEEALKYTFGFLDGRGIRVGWRVEYALSQFPRKEVDKYIKEHNNLSIGIDQSIERIISNSVEDYLLNLSNSNDQKMKDYARQVLSQIRIGETRNPSRKDSSN